MARPRVVALAAVEVSEEDTVVIWAATEFWTVDPDLPNATVTIYRYDLQYDPDQILTPTSPELSVAWIELPALIADPTNMDHNELSLFSLAAMPNPTASSALEFLIFAGTDRGIHKFDNGWVLQELEQRIIFDLHLTTNDSPKLLAATSLRLRELDPSTLEGPARSTGDESLTIATYGDQFWVGTAFDGIYHCNVGSNCSPDNTPELGKPVHSLWVTPQTEGSSTWIQYAGTNDGIYRRIGGGPWQDFNQTSGAGGETLAHTSVSALRQVDDYLFAGTAQRGLWRRNVGNTAPTNWVRLTQGLPRLGRLVDAYVPSNASSWAKSDFAVGALAADGLSTHTLYTPTANFGTLAFTVQEGANAVKLGLFYIAPYVDLDDANLAGLQTRTLTNGVMNEVVEVGFYILVVNASAQIDYEIGVELTVSSAGDDVDV